MHLAACFRLMSPLEIQEEQEEEQQQQKGCMMVMADPSDLGHGKNRSKTDMLCYFAVLYSLEKRGNYCFCEICV